MLLAELHERVHGILAEVRDLVLEREAHCDGPAQQRGRLFAAGFSVAAFFLVTSVLKQAV